MLQHAENPVDWFPWGEEAFAKAKEEDKPIFLSIGYSTCHWCHVMESESFEDEEVAAALNKDFVAIKVDKEERPDIDSIYMAVCQAFTGQGGWPLTILMTPEQKPFFAGTYFPKRRNPKYGIQGILDLLEIVSEKWQTDKEQLIEIGEDITKKLKNAQANSKKETMEEKEINPVSSKKVLKLANEIFKKTFDQEYGGFGSSPKFPTAHNLLFLLHYYSVEAEKEALEMAEKTLQQMYKGGIFDHIGYGFSRYATDEKWLIPHFEKMLYDNALLIMAYLEAFKLTGKTLYKMVAEKTMDYVERELLHHAGGFYSAQDADSEGVEGKFYVFTPAEVESVLGKEEADFFNHFYDITKKGNFEGASIANLLDNPNYHKETTIEEEDSEESKRILNRIKPLREKLFSYRLDRTKLHKDDKILFSWNALMLTAFAKAYGILGDEEYLRRAEACQQFLEQTLTNQETNRISIRYREGKVAGQGNLDDYAFYVWALITLYEVTSDTSYLDKALNYCKIMIDFFWDEKAGGFFFTAKDGEALIYRSKEIYDGAIPSGNSVAAYAFVKIAKMTDSEEMKDIAEKQLSFMLANTENYPAGYSFFMGALLEAIYPNCADNQCAPPLFS